MKLKELRVAERKNQTEFANLFNLTQGTYSNYENGTTEAPMKVLIDIADYYGVTLDYLVGREFKNEVGYLTEHEKKLLENYRSLNEENKRILVAESNGMLLAQL